MPNRISPANMSQRPLYGWANQCCVLEPGLDSYQYVGWGQITTVPKNEIDLVLPSGQKFRADKPFVIPAQATIYRMSVRLPSTTAPTLQYTYGMLEEKATLVGVTGENLKLASTTAAHTTTAPVITAVANAYAPNGAAVLASNEWGALAAPLGTTGAATPFKVYVSNAGNTAAGTGISVSKGSAFVLVEICFKMVAEAIDFERTGYPLRPDSSVTG